MTLLIGMRVRDGAVLASDCLIDDSQLGYVQEEKIRRASVTRGCPSHVSGLFVAEAGTFYGDEYPLTPFLEHAQKRKNFGYTLTGTIPVRSHFESRCLASVRAQSQLGHEETAFMILAYSTDRDVRLSCVKEGIVDSRSCVVEGSGAEFAEDIIEDGFSRDLSLDDAVALSVRALNATLAEPDFRGYQVVVVDSSIYPHPLVWGCTDLHAQRVPSDLSLERLH